MWFLMVFSVDDKQLIWEEQKKCLWQKHRSLIINVTEVRGSSCLANSLLPLVMREGGREGLRRSGRKRGERDGRRGGREGGREGGSEREIMLEGEGGREGRKAYLCPGKEGDLGSNYSGCAVTKSVFLSSL
jgi:hypothetical protein